MKYFFVGYLAGRAAESYFPGTTNLLGWFIYATLALIILAILEGESHGL